MKLNKNCFLRLERIAFVAFPNKIVSLHFINKVSMAKLNFKYRNINKATDILSFNVDVGNLKGEIYICNDQIKRFCKYRKLDYENRIERMFIHGICHLLGHDHLTYNQYKEMTKCQISLYKKAFRIK